MHDRFPLPDPDWAPTRPFWEAAARHEVRIPRCGSCRTWIWYPRERCPVCGEASPRWERVSGRGTLFSFTVVRHAFLPQLADEIPYITGLVALDEDPSVRLVTRVVDAEAADLDIDAPMVVVFRVLRFAGVEGEVTAPCFAPLPEARA